MDRIQFVVNPNRKYIDPKADGYILLNASMLRDENKDLLEGKYSVLNYAIPTEEKYDAEDKYIRNLLEQVVPSYANVINRKYSLNLSVEQYKYYVGIWLYGFLFDAFDRYQTIQHVRDIEGIYTVAGNEDVILPNQREFGFINGYDPNYQMNLYADLFKELNLGVKTILVKSSNKNTISRFEIVKRKLRHLKKGPKKVLEMLIKKYRFERIDIDSKTLVVESRMPVRMEQEIFEKSKADVQFLSSGYFWSKQNSITRNLSIDEKTRKEISSCCFGEDEFETIIGSLISRYIPISFIEATKKIYIRAARLIEDWRFKKIYHSAHITELFAMCCALMKAKGSDIIDIQHGALYCGSKYMGYKEYFVWDQFVCWGWTPEGNDFSNIRPVGMSRVPLEPVKKVSIEETSINRKILMVVGIPELNDSGCGWRYDNYVWEQKQFIENLTDNEREILYIRVRVNDIDKSGGLVQWCQQKYPMIHIEDANQISFPDSLEQSDLLVCDYYGSSHLEALMLGKPFTMFEAAKIISFNSDVKSFIEKFKMYGIYMKTGKELAEQIISHKDYKKWLGSEEIQKLYKDYLYTLTRANEGLVELWTNEFI